MEYLIFFSQYDIENEKSKIYGQDFLKKMNNCFIFFLDFSKAKVNSNNTVLQNFISQSLAWPFKFKAMGSWRGTTVKKCHFWRVRKKGRRVGSRTLTT